MKNPCKKCVVRPACSKTCDAYIKFLNFASEFSTLIAIAISCIIICPILLHLSFQMDQGKEWAEITTAIIWIFGFIISTVLQSSLDEEYQISFMARLLFSPLIAICFIFFYLAKSYCKRGGNLD